MGRRKKEEENNSSDKKEKKKPAVRGDVKRSVAAIFLFALAVILILGYLSDAGILGKYLNKISGIIFGSVKWVMPFVFAIAGVILLFRKERAFYVSKLLGLAAAFLGVLGIFHAFSDNSKILEVAKKGEGGGYLGYLILLSFTKLAGKSGGIIIIAAIFMIGAIIAFNFSISGFLLRMAGIFRKKESDEKEYTPYAEDVANDKFGLEEKPEEQPAEIKKEETTEDPNIKQINFIEDVNDKKKSESGEKFSAPGAGKKRIKDEFFVHGLDQKWKSPPTDILEKESEKAVGGDIERQAEVIKNALKHFGIEVELGEIKTGPTVTQYSFQPAPGVKLSRITELNSNLALALSQHPIRIEAPIPGKPFVGIEVPNKKKARVRLREMLESNEFQARKSNLNIALGKDVSGSFIFADLAKMPHLLIAGSTGKGKSICINTILLSLFYQNSPQDMKIVLVDPKRVELTSYNRIPYLAGHGVIVESAKVINALKRMVGEMEKRYRLLQEMRSKDIISYNQKVKEGQKRTYNDPTSGELIEEELKKLPYIVVIIDEMAELMASHGKVVEGAIIRLAQMARAVGIHLVLSTQRPDVNVLTGLIKANITTRIAFQVATQIDSRTVLDMSGAEKLVGNGDMLYLSAEYQKPKRIQGVFVSENEVKEVVKYILKEARNFDENGELENIAEPPIAGGFNFSGGEISDDEDAELYEKAKDLVTRFKKASASLLQRHLRLGYPKAARILDRLEEEGIVGPAEGSKPREILTQSDNSAVEPNYEDPKEDQSVRDKWKI